MEEQSKQAAPAVDHGLQDRLEQIAAKVIFLKCVLPEDALGDQALFGFGLILGDIARDISAAGELPGKPGLTMAPETLHDLLRELEEVHALQIPDDDHDDEETRYKRNWSLREKIDAIPARTIDELKVKARAAQIALERDVDHSNDGLGSFANLAQSICRDVDAIASAASTKAGHHHGDAQEHPAMASTQDRAEETSMTRRKHSDLEGKIEDLRNMSIVLETVMDDLWKQEDDTKKNDLYKSFVFTNDQFSSTQFAVSNIGNMARELSKYFYAIDESE